MPQPTGGTSWLEGISAFLVLVFFAASWWRARRRRNRRD
ncbi:hypothetical protein CryarDRAFT_2136 [Cryptosporangium arvum DSM 44712]|jgi:hypothetical protein|uniref:Uncharacterized protein n=1 Tax=Cryptosporangium arvum DSM 44712 TaxID=927661 RepID=A0A011AG92_9ACTN|nr:hypothetical protein CryarDRAFT_2136 [Cryptosporangium arvum DSM 44712]